ncbi:GNAT family N-acetyltransferase [Mycolicibacterium litorale]|uniref:GNAT family N-acetyltransferase n=1 Tax=Mycolicibacterium litorale TaxID=758802 RepID=UPI003CF03C37
MTLRLALDGVYLQPPTDDDLVQLARRAADPGAVLPPGEAHFVTWIAGRTPQQSAQDRIARVQANRDHTRRPGWTLDLAVMVEEQPAGVQSLSGFDQWPHHRVVGTTSWLLAAFQDRGIGTLARAAVLELAFAHLRAESAKSWVLDENRASIGVSTKLGYRLIDRHHITEHGSRYAEGVYQLDRDAWLESPVRPRYRPAITGAEHLVHLLDR